MKKYIIAAVAALGIAVPVVAPAVASASTVNQVQKWFLTREGRIVRNKMSLVGARFEGLTVKCASDGQSQFSCYATYTAYYQGQHLKYGQWATVRGGAYGSIIPGRSSLLRTW